MSNGAINPPIYLPFSAVAGPLTQSPSAFSSTSGMGFTPVLVPFAPVVDAGWNEALHCVVPVEADMYHEFVQYNLPAGVQDVLIPFAVEKISPVILLAGSMITNFVDSSPLTGLSFTVTGISTSFVGVQMNALLPTGNYVFQALATVMR